MQFDVCKARQHFGAAVRTKECHSHQGCGARSEQRALREKGLPVARQDSAASAAMTLLFVVTLVAAVSALSKRICGCGRPLYPSPHSMFEDRAKIYREAEGRVVTNICARHMDSGVPVAGDNRRLEVVVHGLPLSGTPHNRVPCSWKWRTKIKSSNHGLCCPDPSQETQPEVLPRVNGPKGHWLFSLCRLTAGGQRKRSRFVGQLTKARALSEPRVLQRRGWFRRGD